MFVVNPKLYISYNKGRVEIIIFGKLNKFTEDGLCLLEEARSLANFGKEMAKFSTRVPKTEYKIKDTNAVPSVCSFLSKEVYVF